MTDTLLVTSTESGTGKTAIAIALGRLARDRGSAVGYMKPKGTRLRTRVGKVLDTDPMLAQEALGIDDPLETMEPVVYSTTFLYHVIRGGESIDSIHDAVHDAHETIATDRDLVVVEGANRTSTGSLIQLTDADVADLVAGQVLLIAEYDGARSLDELIASAQQFGDRLLGVLFNGIGYDSRDELESDVIPFLEGRGFPIIGVLPRERELATIDVGELAAEIGANLLTECPTDGRVARFAVGAMSSDAALRHFRRSRDAVVITGGDRPGIQTAALEAPGIRGLVLTGGYRPPSRILSRADDRGIPMMTVDGDTLSTIDRVDSALGEARVRNVEEIDQMRGLLESHADIESVLDL